MKELRTKLIIHSSPWILELKRNITSRPHNTITWLFHLVYDMIFSQLAKQDSFSLHIISVHCSAIINFFYYYFAWHISAEFSDSFIIVILFITIQKTWESIHKCKIQFSAWDCHEITYKHKVNSANILLTNNKYTLWKLVLNCPPFFLSFIPFYLLSVQLFFTALTDTHQQLQVGVTQAIACVMLELIIDLGLCHTYGRERSLNVLPPIFRFLPLQGSFSLPVTFLIVLPHEKQSTPTSVKHYFLSIALLRIQKPILHFKMSLRCITS